MRRKGGRGKLSYTPGFFSVWMKSFLARFADSSRFKPPFVQRADEFGHGGTSTLSHFGPVHNPWDIERIAGFPGRSGLYSCCSAARIRDQLDRRSSIKSGVKAFSITFGFATNKMVPDDSLAEGTIYVLNNLPKTASNLSKAPILSAG